MMSESSVLGSVTGDKSSSSAVVYTPPNSVAVSPSVSPAPAPVPVPVAVPIPASAPVAKAITPPTTTRAAAVSSAADAVASAPAPSNHREKQGTEAAVAASVRGTVEYRAAWDVELWKAVQAARLQRQLEEQKKKALAALAKFVKTKEQHAVANCEIKERDLVRREQRVAEEEKQIERRKWRLTEMEKDLRQLRQQLADARRRAEEDAMVEVQRAKEDAAHTVALQQQRVQAAEAQTQRAEERLQQAQRDYLALSEEFHRFRTRGLTAPPESITSVESRLRAEFAVEQQALQDRLERRHKENEHQLLQRCRELEEENKRLTALATKRREQLRRTTDDLAHLKLVNGALEEQLQRLGTTATSAAGATAAEDSNAASGGKKKRTAELKEGNVVQQAQSVHVSSLVKEIERLRRERRTIVEDSAGALDEDSDVVRCLDARISDMVRELHAHNQEMQQVVG
ncbi:uncharacterized protein TM35_000202480 [Trypanosoma theileri]|uniref:Uncharacterized protein n=1 Tax=Trypanosoma theileri TaxID=67003 RepID=A0A1X0NUG8_9TRYP|nr:uncharacterized protein TM35_000202480 [Trypanosoma theileri]ORC87839.1 hypothetical protein TM35_000202480 [Trypanosoma theileri]